MLEAIPGSNEYGTVVQTEDGTSIYVLSIYVLSSILEISVSGAHYPSPAHVVKLMISCASHVYGPLVYILMPPPPPPPRRRRGKRRPGRVTGEPQM